MPFIGNIGPLELAMLLLLALLLFGKRLPSTMRALGSSLNEFRRGVREVQSIGEEAHNEIQGVARDVNAITRPGDRR